MSGKQIIAIFAQNGAQSRYLSDIARLSGAEPLLTREPAPEAALILAAETGFAQSPDQDVILLGAATATHAHVHSLSPPVKASIVLSRIQKILTRINASPSTIKMGDATLDTRENLWLRDEIEPVRLTEKETEILVYLHHAAGVPVTRDDLLHHVWAYAKDVQTHTLETHIYRLRQKIEHDPSAPQILLTDDNGYRLSGG